MAWIDFCEDACLVDKRTESDGMGGVIVSWSDGAPIKAGFVRDSTTEAKIAYQNGIREIFTIVFSDLLELSPNDRVNFPHHVRRARHDYTRAERYALSGG